MLTFVHVMLLLHRALQRHLSYLESVPAEHELMLAGLNSLIKISYVDDTEVFKSCLDYWQLFVADIFGSCTTHTLAGGLDCVRMTV
jgi:exportin-1